MRLVEGAAAERRLEKGTARRVLLVEDVDADADAIARELACGDGEVAVARVRNPVGMTAALDCGAWDLVIGDSAASPFSAFDALAIARERGLDLPLIVVSGTGGEELAVEAMRAGADDYVIKERLSRLGPVVERACRERALRAAHRASEEALRASEARFTRLSESGILGIVSGNDSGDITEANEAFLRMTGFSREEVAAGKVRWEDLTAPEWREVTARAIGELRATGRATPYEKEYVRKDGSRLPVLVGIASLGSERSAAFIIDLTAQKHAERELRRVELHLRQAQKMEAIGKLAGSVAHDFNNVLSIVMSYSLLLAEGFPAEHPIRADLAGIDEAAKRGADLTRQLLLFSREQAFEPGVVDLNGLLAGMAKMLPRLIGEDVELTFECCPSLGRTRVDRGHVEQVVMNLAVNARDAMPNGGKLTIETQNVTLDEAFAREHPGCSAGPHILLAVSDTGIGMDAATQARIFEPFFTTKEPGRGTGLGLTTVFGIVQQSGGTVWVYSELQRGTTFKIFLPRVDAPLDEVADSVKPAIQLGTETVVLVEDDERVRAVAFEILRKHRYKVVEMASPVEALAYCERHGEEIHLLLTDVVMPQMNGPELARRVAAARPGTKVLFMSGYSDGAITRHGDVEPGAAFLQKPFTPTMLTTKVRAVLDGTCAAVQRDRSGS